MSVTARGIETRVLLIAGFWSPVFVAWPWSLALIHTHTAQIRENGEGEENEGWKSHSLRAVWRRSGKVLFRRKAPIAGRRAGFIHPSEFGRDTVESCGYCVNGKRVNCGIVCGGVAENGRDTVENVETAFPWENFPDLCPLLLAKFPHELYANAGAASGRIVAPN